MNLAELFNLLIRGDLQVLSVELSRRLAREAHSARGSGTTGKLSRALNRVRPGKIHRCRRARLVMYDLPCHAASSSSCSARTEEKSLLRHDSHRRVEALRERHDTDRGLVPYAMGFNPVSGRAKFS